MRILSIVAVIATNLFIGVSYWRLLRARRIQPALAMWVFFTIAVVGSLVTYLAEGSYGLLDNILNTTDVVMVGSVTILILIYGDRSTRFTRFDLGCLVAVVGIVAFWAATRQHAVSHLLIQAILVIGYFPVVRRLLKSSRNTESFAIWIAMFLAPAFGLLSSKGWLATVYSVRNLFCTAALLALMARVEWKARRAQRPTEEDAE
ncbi:MAG: hypothetical protein NTY63_09315 [Candidatus Bipolaricaulota bacterium]|nr:hypothetical protein [Candidatus Bipolaricaulota bacterium]